MSNYKQIRTEKDYLSLKSSGMLWEFYPEFSGDWDKDFKDFIQPEIISEMMEGDNKLGLYD